MAETDAVIELIEKQDAFVAVELLAREPDPLATARTFVQVMRHLYWQKQNLARAVQFGQAGANFALVHAARFDASDSALAAQLRGIAKGLMYDIASFTWPGWDEPGITITATDLALGLDAALANLRLARELNKGDLALSRAFWMLAGHRLCASDYTASIDGYEFAARHAALAGAKAEELLAAGFVRLTDLIANPADTINRQQLDSIQRELRTLDGGPEFVRQIQTAIRVFFPRKAIAP